jgi:replication fork protection complex subunit Csm3/Swi3
MTVYQLWAHQMFPRGTFKDTVARVEKVCSARRMDVSFLDAYGPLTCRQVALSGIMDAERPASPPLDVDGIDDSGVASSRMDMESTARRLFEPAPSLSRSPSPASAPGRRPVEEDDDGGPSIEELMAIEEEQAGWEAMDAIGQGLDEPSSAQAQAAMAPEDDYDDLYD